MTTEPAAEDSPPLPALGWPLSLGSCTGQCGRPTAAAVMGITIVQCYVPVELMTVISES